MRSSIPKKNLCTSVFLVTLSFFIACGDDHSAGHHHHEADAAIIRPDAAPGDYEWNVPSNLPLPFVPKDNPMTEAKVDLGRHLFYDTRLSGNETQSCESCHIQALAFADGKTLPTGSTGDTVPRNAPALMNVAYHSTFTWVNPNFFHFETQLIVPIFGEDPTELGVSGRDDEVLSRFSSDSLYQELFAEAFPGEEAPINYGNIVKGLSSFVRSMVSFDSPYDRYAYGGQADAISEAAKRGEDLFFEERIDCHHCHGGFHFSLNTRHAGTVFLERGFANNGLYNVDGQGSYPSPNAGLIDFTGKLADRGKFRSSSLRNIALSAPYMHDGSIATLSEVLDHYARGGRLIETGPNAGDGRASPFKSEFVHGFELSAQERSDLLEFFDTLTDESFTTDPRFFNPFAD